MSPEEVERWFGSVVLDMANVAEADECWRLRELARQEVYGSRGRKPESREPWNRPLPDDRLT